VARTRTTKKLAQRIDLNYFKRPTPYKRAKLWLTVLIPLLALGWIVWRGISRDSRVYSSGRLSEPHAVLEKQCVICHLQKAGEFSSKAADGACLACHDGPIHHENDLKAAVPACTACHVEHRGRINLRAASNQSCAECHGNLRTKSRLATYAAHIETLENGHPEFAILRPGVMDPDTIALNHAIHMKPIRRGPNGPVVQLECGDCHRPETVKAPWPYADTKYLAAIPSYKEEDEFLLQKTAILSPRRRMDGREYMAPAKFDNACAGCHLLTFDKRFAEGAPHDKPKVVRAYLLKKFSEYIAVHPAELREMQEPERKLAGGPITPRAQYLTPTQWVRERTAVAEELLWKKTCAQCHLVTGAQLQDTTLGRWDAVSAQNVQQVRGVEGHFPIAESPLPTIAPAKITTRWLPHAKFDHDAHRGFSCAGCHPKALTSKETSDVLVPGIEDCKPCHAPGPEHAESRCFECHTYHDWSKRKEVQPTFTLPGLRTGGR
jgi:hypothetical protein